MPFRPLLSAALVLASAGVSTVAFSAERNPDWAGFYGGLNLGYGIASNPTNHSNAMFATTETFAMAPDGILGGIQLGYNWQWGQWVAGLETDLQLASQKDSACALRCIGALATAEIDQKLTWFGTTRGRLGWTTGPALFYVTAGLAYGHVKNGLVRPDGANPIEIYSFGHTKTGWAAGLGFETALAGNWSAKVEYLHINLGGYKDTYSHLGLVEESLAGSVRNNIFRAGLNYRFAHGGTRTTSWMPENPAHEWDGLYAGLNVGYGAGRGTSVVNATGFQPQNESFTMNPSGGLGGVQVGFNRQFARHWVAGLETDFQFAGQSSSEICAIICSQATPIFVSMDQKLKWFGTVRGRLGFTAGPALIYGTGGFAYGRVDTRGSYFSQSLLGSNLTALLDMSSVKGGWTIGGGIESAVANAWTVKLEYLYLDLGSQSASATNNFGLGFTNVVSASSHLRESVIRLGLNYKIQ